MRGAGDARAVEEEVGVSERMERQSIFIRSEGRVAETTERVEGATRRERGYISCGAQYHKYTIHDN